MKFVLLSDLHLLWENPIARLDNAHETQIKKFKFVLQYAQENECSILIAGDIFDRPRNWYLLPIIITLLKEYSVPIYAIYGQHDYYLMSDNKKSTNLGILIESGLVKKIGRDTEIQYGRLGAANILHLHGANWGEQLLEVSGNGIHIGVIHAPIGSHQIKGIDNFMEEFRFAEEHQEYNLILCGDIHQQFLSRKGSTWICNSGPLLRMDASKESFEQKPLFFVYDTDKDTVDPIEISHELAEKVLTRAHLDKEEKLDKMLEQFTSAIKTGADSGASFFEILDSLLKSKEVSDSVRNIISKLTLDK